LAIAFLGATGMAWGQISSSTLLSGSASPLILPAMEEPWPAVDLGLAPMTPDVRAFSQQPLPLDDQPTLPLHFGTKNVVMQFRSGENTVIGPIIDLMKSLPEPPKAGAGTTELEPEPGPLRLGNISFNRTAESFNLGKADDVRKDDLSRQLGKLHGSPQIADSTPITGWAIGGVALLVILIAMAIGNFEGDKDDRNRRKKARRHRHRHSS
jgi:hypothetical protein